MSPAFAAVGAGLAALFEAALGSRYQVIGAQLQLVLVLGIAVTLVYGFEEGMVWAFVGGLLLDFLAMRPVGSTPFELLALTAATQLAAPLVARSRYPGVIATVVVMAPIYLFGSHLLTGLLNPPVPAMPLTALVATAVANGVLAAVLAPLVIGLKRRGELRQRALWWR